MQVSWTNYVLYIISCNTNIVSLDKVHVKCELLLTFYGQFILLFFPQFKPRKPEWWGQQCGGGSNPTTTVRRPAHRRVRDLYWWQKCSCLCLSQLFDWLKSSIWQTKHWWWSCTITLLHHITFFISISFLSHVWHKKANNKYRWCCPSMGKTTWNVVIIIFDKKILITKLYFLLKFFFSIKLLNILQSMTISKNVSFGSKCCKMFKHILILSVSLHPPV